MSDEGIPTPGIKFPDHPATKILTQNVEQRKISFTVDLSEWEETEKWLQDFFLLNNFNFKIETTKPPTKFTKYTKYYRCILNKRNKNNCKNSDCGAYMVVKGKLPERCEQDHYLCTVEMTYGHNHPLHSPQCRPVHYRTREKLKELLTVYGPAEALAVLKLDLEVEYGPELYPFVVCDTALCPKLQYIYNLQRKMLAESYGSCRATTDDLDTVLNKIRESGTLVRHEVQESYVVVALLTPLMSRAHALPESGELVLIDAIRGMSRNQCRVFLLVTSSPAGGLPLGVFITTSDSIDVIKTGLRLLGEILPAAAFNGRGSEGPAVFMTDDSEAERQALSSVYPRAALLLCVFHILQAFWKYLWSKGSGVDQNDKPALFALFKATVYATSDTEMMDKYNILLQNKVLMKNERLFRHVQAVWAKRSSWSLVQREDRKLQGHNTNNFVEAAFRVLRDKVLCRVKAFTIVQLSYIVSDTFSNYYSKKLIDVVNSNLTSAAFRRFGCQQPSVTKEAITIFADGQLYSVPSEQDETQTYLVDMELGSCSCTVGLNGQPCKHQYAVYFHFDACKEKFNPVSEELKLKLYEVATGNRNVSASEVMMEDDVAVGTGTSKNKVEEAHRLLDHFYATLKGKLSAHPEIFAGPISTFLKKLPKKREPNTAFASALVSFGGSGERKRPRKKVKVEPSASTHKKSANMDCKSEEVQVCVKRP